METERKASLHHVGKDGVAGCFCDVLLSAKALQIILPGAQKMRGGGRCKLQNADNLTFFNSISSMRAEKGQVKDNKQVMPLLDAAANAINNAHW